MWVYDLVTFWKLPNLTDRDLPHLDLTTSEKLANLGRINPRHCERWLIYRDNRNSTAHDYGLGFAEETLVLLPQFIKDATALATAIDETNA